MKKINCWLAFIFLMLLGVSCQAADLPVTADSVVSIIKLSMAPAVNRLTTQAMIWLGAFASIQFFITNFGLLKSGADIEAIFGKLIGSLTWIGFCIYVLQNGPQFIAGVGNDFFGLLGLTLPSPGSIIAMTTGIVSVLGVAAAAVGLASTTSGMLLIYILLAVFAIGMLFAFKIFMVQLELALIVILSPLSFAFLGLNALKDQGIAPFKALISLGYRIILLTLILSAFTQVSSAVSSALNVTGGAVIANGIGSTINTMFSALGAYLMLAYLLYKSDSIAATLAGGGTNMGTGDVASAAAMGAAAGAAIATGGAAAAGSAAKIPSMADFMRNLNGGGAVSNASSSGAGSTPVGMAPRPSSSMSTAGSGPSSASGSQSKSAAPAPSNSSPRSSASSTGSAPGGSAGSTSQTAQNAFDGVAAAGGSEAAATAAAEAAAGGGSNEAVSAAVVNAGGTVAQGAAAATAMAIGEAGGSPAAIKAGAQAAGAGKSSAEVGEAVSNTLVPGTAMGQPREVAAAAASASQTKPAQAPVGVAPVQSASPGSGATAGIGASATPLEQTLEKLTGVLEKQGHPTGPGFRDHMKDLGQHAAQEKATTGVSINTHHSD